MKHFFLSLCTFISLSGISQTTDTDGSYTLGTNWVGNSYPGSLGGGTLTLDEEHIFIENYITLGSYASNINVSAVGNSSPKGSFNVNDTLIVYGSMTFANKAMPLNIGANGVLIILGDLNMNNQISVDSDGVIIVKGKFNFTGSAGHNEYDGGPSSKVYAGEYSSNATSDITNDGGDPEDIDNDLFAENPGFWEFVNGNGATPLPITLKEFKAESTTSGVALNWTTLTEENFEYFEIQRAAADGNFSIVETVSGNGFSKDEISYSWADENPRIGINYYRLESVDFDGYRETFPAVSILFEPENRKISISPNPISQQSVLTLKNTFGEDFKLKIVGLDGVEKLSTQGADNQMQLPSNMKKGIYLAIFEINGLRKTQKLIVR